MRARARKPRRTFADIDAARQRYNPEAEGYGSPQEWRREFHARMGWAEARRIVDSGQETPREILGVGLGATWSEIVSAFRRLAMACHPDRVAVTGMTVEAATEQFKRVSAAYVLLEMEFGK
jgi:DnaJ-domain-containing protein 1